MVQEILRSLAAPIRGIARPVSGLHQAAYLLAILTLASQVLSLVRDRLFAHAFGASETLDLYYAAFKIPDLVFALVASLVSAYVIIPLIANTNTKESRETLSHAASFLLFAGGLVSAVLAVFAPQLAFALFPSFEHSAQADTFVLLVRILLVQPLLLGVSGVLTSVTQVKRRFILFALSPVLYNLGIIAGVVFLYPMYGLIGIGYGVVIGALLHLLIHVPVVLASGLFPRLVIPSPRIIGGIIAHSLPRSLALSMTSVIALVLATLAATVGKGAVSVFSFAANLAAVPLSLIGASYATAAFPVLAEQAQERRSKEFGQTVSAAARHIIFWSSVVTVLTIVLRAHIVRFVLGTGAFDWSATRLTAAVLAILVVGLTSQGITLLCARAFYASKRSWNPFFIQLGDIGISIAVAWGLLKAAEAYPMLRYFMESLFRVSDVPNTGILFIAFGAALGQVLVSIVALATLRTVAPGVARSLTKPLFDGFGAAILGGAAAYGVLILMGNLAPLTTLLAVFTQGLLAGIVGFAVACGVLLLLENKELRDLWNSLSRFSSRALTPSGAATLDR
ncbi:MAG: virulence factor [Parcubacteria bacterium C7867-001]|nr:MAG: virulence factor [Parcubacteria bacterium C7867-001]